jgi:DNA-binding XRE family transcriptional regulator
MQTFNAHLREKLQDESFHRLYEEECQLAELSVKLLEARTRLGWSQKEVAQKADITQQQLSRLENGLSCHITTLLKVCKALGFKVELASAKEVEPVA